METLMSALRTEEFGEEYAQCSFNWCSAKVDDLQFIRKLLDANDPRESEINNAVDLLLEERARLLGIMRTFVGE